MCVKEHLRIICDARLHIENTGFSDVVNFNGLMQIQKLVIQLFHFISFTLVTNAVLHGITEWDNVIVKFNDTVKDNIGFVILNNRALGY
jgi:hypothetical protein